MHIRERTYWISRKELANSLGDERFDQQIGITSQARTDTADIAKRLGFPCVRQLGLQLGVFLESPE